jgi:aspartyl/asparaginyl beta-hydroxylase (cupin superfamily)
MQRMLMYYLVQCKARYIMWKRKQFERALALMRKLVSDIERCIVIDNGYSKTIIPSLVIKYDCLAGAHELNRDM